MKRIIFPLIFIFILFAVVIFYNNKIGFNLSKKQKSSSSSTPNLTKVRVGYMPFTTNWVMFLALEKEMFKDAGLEVEPISFNSGTDALNALAQGNIAVHAINVYTDILNMEARTPGLFKLFIVQQSTNSVSSVALVVLKNSPIKSIKQLTGKKIGMTPGTFSETLFRKAYEKEIDFSKGTQIVKLAPSLQLNTLESGQINALLAYEPNVTFGIEKGTTVILENHPWAKIQDPFPMGGYTISTKFLNDNHEISKKLITVLNKSWEYGNKHPKEVVSAISKFANIDIDIVAKLRKNEEYLVSNISKEYFKNVAQLYFNLGLVKKVVDTTNFKYVD